MNQSDGRKIGIIIPSFNDPRIVRTIYSIIKHDPNNITRLYVIDGGSRQEVIDLIKSHIRDSDYFVSEKDKGIFDALNKGMDAVKEEILGWVGSDDYFTRLVNFDAIAEAFASEDIDCYLFDLVFTDGAKSTRRSKAMRITPFNMRFGRHTMHFSSFWRMSCIGDIRFDLHYPIAADQKLFCQIAWSSRAKAKIDHTVVMIAHSGGNSSKDIRRIGIANIEVFRIFCEFMNPVNALLATICKVGRKVINSIAHTPYALIDDMVDLIVKL
jgi:glycosyltransferase involved in cell wall biosynthesis